MSLATFTSSCRSPQAQAPSAPSSNDKVRPRGPVLFVVTSSSRQVLRNGKERPTGVFLNELYLPAVAVRAAGHDVVIATPDGEAPAIDPEGLKEGYWESAAVLEKARRWAREDPMMTTPIHLESALQRVDEWAGVVIPGGQGVMNDVVQNPKVHDLVLSLARNERPIGLICHAPALLIYLPSEGNPLLGKRVTSVSPFEEFFIETFIMGGKPRTRKIGRQLRGAGFAYDSARPKANYAVGDGNLVTSQNPYSGEAFVREFSIALGRSG